MNNQRAGFIIGAYPCAPSFHQKNETEEVAFWRGLADMQDIRGLEQPCLQTLHPFGDEWLFSHIPDAWDLVVTAIMGTMQQRAVNPAFGLASSDDTQRKACINWYRHLYNKINHINDEAGRQRVMALELHAAPDTRDSSVARAAEAFAASMDEIEGWDWPCPLVLEHCDAMDKPAARKGFLPLENVLECLNGRQTTVALNWARSAIEGRSTQWPLRHTQQTVAAGKLTGLMFSGTTCQGPYGEWQDLHAPFAPFSHSEAGCEESLMTVALAQEMIHAANKDTLQFMGIKLLEINKEADVQHRLAILQDGIRALRLSTTQ